MFRALLLTALLLKMQTSDGQLRTEELGNLTHSLLGASSSKPLLPAKCVKCEVSQPKLSSNNTFTVIGQNVTLLCSSSQGSLPIDFMLFRGTHRVSTTTVQKGNRTAEFTFNVNNNSDAGEYKCTAENTFTKDKKYSNGFNFTLVEPVSRPRLWSDTSFTVSGQSVTLFCFSGTGTLPITYRLFQSGKHLGNDCTEEVHKNGRFQLPIYNMSDTGEYKCAAENNFTTPKKYSNGLNFTLAEPVSKPILYTSAISTTLGREVNLSCQSDYGTPPINYSFFKGDTLLSFITKRDRLAAVLTLNLNSTTDFGTYQCKAENMLANMGKHSDAFNFTVAAVEDPSSSGLVIGILALCLVVLFLIIAISLWNLPNCKARKKASLKTDDIAPEKETGSPASKECIKDSDDNTQDVEYSAIFITARRNVVEQEESAIEYSEILMKADN